VQPYTNETRDTISKWIKAVLNRLKIDITEFGSHTVRSAAVAKTKVNMVPVNDILAKAGWYKEFSFAKF
jgi:hypothetical protein